MTELKLFTTPAEEMDLSTLRTKVMQLYDQAFTQIRHQLSINDHTDKVALHHEIVGICIDTIEQCDALARQHVNKWSPKCSKPSPSPSQPF